MRRDFFLILLLFVLVFVVLVKASSNDKVTIFLNGTSVWWNDVILANGTATYLNGAGIANSNVVLSISNITYCTNTTDSNGNWNCVFNAPLEIGNYQLFVNVTNSTGSSTINSTSFSVSPTYGSPPIGTVERVALQIPMLIQDYDGSIRSVIVVVMTWKGS